MRRAIGYFFPFFVVFLRVVVFLDLVDFEVVDFLDFVVFLAVLAGGVEGSLTTLIEMVLGSAFSEIGSAMGWSSDSGVITTGGSGMSLRLT